MTIIHCILQLSLIFFIFYGHNTATGHNKNNNQECGRLKADDVTKRIVGGNVAREWPWMGAIFYIIKDSIPRKGYPVCGCSLISSRWVLTAAHCVINRETSYSIDNFNKYVDLDLVEVMFGQTELNKAKGSTHKLKRAYIMPGYKPGSTSDLALLELLEPVENSDTIRPVCLDFDGIFDCTPESCPSECIAIGWGSKKNALGPVSKVLYEVTRPMMNNNKCALRWKNVSPMMQCFGTTRNGKGVCSGDSGGPILCEKDGVWYQAAVISRTIVRANNVKGMMECGSEDSFDLHVKMSNAKVSGWIKMITGTGNEGWKKDISFSFDA